MGYFVTSAKEIGFTRWHLSVGLFLLAMSRKTTDRIFMEIFTDDVSLVEEKLDIIAEVIRVWSQMYEFLKASSTS